MYFTKMECMPERINASRVHTQLFSKGEMGRRFFFEVNVLYCNLMDWKVLPELGFILYGGVL